MAYCQPCFLIRWDLANEDRVRLVGFKHYINSLGSNPCLFSSKCIMPITKKR